MMTHLARNVSKQEDVVSPTTTSIGDEVGDYVSRAEWNEHIKVYGSRRELVCTPPVYSDLPSLSHVKLTAVWSSNAKHSDVPS